MDLWKVAALDQRKSHSDQAKSVVVSFQLILKLQGTFISNWLRHSKKYSVNLLVIL